MSQNDYVKMKEEEKPEKKIMPNEDTYIGTKEEETKENVCLYVCICVCVYVLALIFLCAMSVITVVMHPLKENSRNNSTCNCEMISTERAVRVPDKLLFAQLMARQEATLRGKPCKYAIIQRYPVEMLLLENMSWMEMKDSLVPDQIVFLKRCSSRATYCPKVDSECLPKAYFPQMNKNIILQLRNGTSKQITVTQDIQCECRSK